MIILYARKSQWLKALARNYSRRLSRELLLKTITEMRMIRLFRFFSMVFGAIEWTFLKITKGNDFKMKVLRLTLWLSGLLCFGWLQPNPPQKPPRKLQGVSAHYESLPRCVGRQKPRQKSCYSVDLQTPTASSVQLQQPKRSLPTASSSGYELVYLARTGSRAEASEKAVGTSVVIPQPRFRVQSTGNYVEMANREPSSYENVEASPAGQTGACVDDDSIYDIPRELGGSKAYENVSFHPADGTSSSHPATSSSSSPKSTTPESPSRLPNMPPTPDHPPPPAHMAEQSIHLRIRPLSEVLIYSRFSNCPIFFHLASHS